MNTQTDLMPFLQVLLSMFWPQVPVLLVSLVALIIIFVKWKQAPTACLWALLGFGLRLLLCVAIPVAQTMVHNARMQGHYSVRETGLLLGWLSLLWAVLVATSYVLMLVAIFVGRSKRAA